MNFLPLKEIMTMRRRRLTPAQIREAVTGTLPEGVYVIPKGYAHAGGYCRTVPGSGRGGGYSDEEIVEVELLRKPIRLRIRKDVLLER